MADAPLGNEDYEDNSEDEVVPVRVRPPTPPMQIDELGIIPEQNGQNRYQRKPNPPNNQVLPNQRRPSTR